MRIVAEYTGEPDQDKYARIIEASGASQHESTYHMPTKTHRITFKAPDQNGAEMMRDRIEHTGVELSKLEVRE